MLGKPLSGQKDVMLVIVDATDPEMENGLQQWYQNGYPELAGLDGDLEVLETGIRAKYNEGIRSKRKRMKKKGNEETKRREIH